MDTQVCLGELHSIVKSVKNNVDIKARQRDDTLLERLELCYSFLSNLEEDYIRDDKALIALALCLRKLDVAVPFDVLVSKVAGSYRVSELISDVMRLRMFIRIFHAALNFDTSLRRVKTLQKESSDGTVSLCEIVTALGGDISLFLLIVGDFRFRLSDNCHYFSNFSSDVVRFVCRDFITDIFKPLCILFLKE